MRWLERGNELSFSISFAFPFAIHRLFDHSGALFTLTFFGGRIAMADLGVIETWC